MTKRLRGLEERGLIAGFPKGRRAELAALLEQLPVSLGDHSPR